ncbi:MAG: DUF3782 domain-containing protein [Promethearchaeota archaeon]|nr:MAG: DUF3782 domain-containing protein [Candidatus Lokiarchaeota archaeon]
MNPESKEEIKSFIELNMQKQFEKYFKVYSSEELVTKSEFLEAIKLLNARFEAVDKRFEELIASMNKGFEAVDKRFEAVDKRFEAVDKRFEELIASMNKRFEAVDKRFEAVDKRFEELIASMNKRFEAVDKRFEAVDKRFEAVDKRFEELIASMNKRFEAVDKRFEELIDEIKLIKAWTGTVGDREGKDFEKTIRELLRQNIKNRFIDISKIEKIRVQDVQGEVVLPNQKVEMDNYASDGRRILMEVKFHMTLEKLIFFYKKAAFIEKMKNFEAEKLILAIEIDQDALLKAEELGIGVITKDLSI